MVEDLPVMHGILGVFIRIRKTKEGGNGNLSYTVFYLTEENFMDRPGELQPSGHRDLDMTEVSTEAKRE